MKALRIFFFDNILLVTSKNLTCKKTRKIDIVLFPFYLQQKKHCNPKVEFHCSTFANLKSNWNMKLDQIVIQNVCSKTILKFFSLYVSWKRGPHHIIVGDGCENTHKVLKSWLLVTSTCRVWTDKKGLMCQIARLCRCALKNLWVLPKRIK